MPCPWPKRRWWHSSWHKCCVVDPSGRKRGGENRGMFFPPEKTGQKMDLFWENGDDDGILEEHLRYFLTDTEKMKNMFFLMIKKLSSIYVASCKRVWTLMSVGKGIEISNDFGGSVSLVYRWSDLPWLRHVTLRRYRHVTLRSESS